MTSIIDSSELYDRYRIGITIRERMDGGVPKDPKLIEQWVAAKTGHKDEETQKQVESHMPDVEAAADEVAETMWCGFKRDVEREFIFIETRQVKAMLRECCVVLGITKKKRGSRQVIQHGFEIKGLEGGSKIPINVKSEGTHEGAIHVMTPQGPRSALKRVDYVGPDSSLVFELWVLGTHHTETRHLGEKDIRRMFALAQEDGLGANRSQGSGKFDVTEFEVLAKAEIEEPKEKKKK